MAGENETGPREVQRDVRQPQHDTQEKRSGGTGAQGNTTEPQRTFDILYSPPSLNPLPDIVRLSSTGTRDRNTPCISFLFQVLQVIYLFEK